MYIQIHLDKDGFFLYTSDSKPPSRRDHGFSRLAKKPHKRCRTSPQQERILGLRMRTSRPQPAHIRSLPWGPRRGERHNPPRGGAVPRIGKRQCLRLQVEMDGSSQR